MGCLKRDAILNGRPPKVTRVDVPEWGDGGYVYVRQLRASEAVDVQKLEGKDDTEVLVGWVVLGVCDLKGKRIFTDKDAPKLMEAPLPTLQRVALAIMEVNGLAGGESGGKKRPTRRSA
jgi:hypothetical protein